MNNQNIVFGKFLKNIRNNLGLRQIDVEHKVGITRETLRRLENGLNKPSLDTLSILSKLYRQDLISFYSSCVKDVKNELLVIKYGIERKLDRNEKKSLTTELSQLNSLSSITNNFNLEKEINQLSYFLQGIMEYEDEDKKFSSLDKLIYATKITKPNFNMSNFNKFFYTSNENRILMNMGLIYNKLGDVERNIFFLNFIFNNIDINDPIYPLVTYNLANSYFILKNYKESFKFIELSLNYLYRTNNRNNITLLYYLKGITEYKLSNKNYINSLNKSLFLAEIFEQQNLKNSMKFKLENFLNLSL